jgi:hypothetical protein
MCVEQRTHFVCHKSTIQGKAICCALFYKEMGNVSIPASVAKKLGFVEFVHQEPHEKLPTYNETNRKR